MTTTLDTAIEQVLDSIDEHTPTGTSSQLPTPPARPEPQPHVPRDLGGIPAALEYGKRSPVKRTQALAAKITAELADLRQRLQDESVAELARRQADAQRAAALDEIAKLERALSAAKARFKGKPVLPAPAAARAALPGASGATVPCGRGCGRTFTSGQGRALHERRAHDGFDPNAAKT